uniref:HDC18999 n=1 Tax=Drosophila melanogaster TaxID=7227 RepID=Q6IIC5_DROME|nr:TPA_inf: HDC18999 [Drosophila melanogaster]
MWLLLVLVLLLLLPLPLLLPLLLLLLLLIWSECQRGVGDFDGAGWPFGWLKRGISPATGSVDLYLTIGQVSACCFD